MELLTTEGFLRRYFDNLKHSATQAEAYAATEIDYQRLHNVEKPRYTSFDSFRQVKNRKMKKILAKK
jgi:hypothetical protein